MLCFFDSIFFNNLYIHGTLELSSELLYYYSWEAQLCRWCLFMHVLRHFITILAVLVFKIILLFHNYMLICISCCWTENGNTNTWSFCSLFDSLMTDRGDGPIGSLPEHLLVEILTRLPTHEWVQISCVSKHWASLFRGEYLWQTAIARKWPSAGFRKRWPGPIPRGSARRRFQALYVSENLVPSGGEIDELVGHTYLYLKEQLEGVAVPPSSILHGTIIDQFIACGRTGEKAHELASNIWIAVIDNLEENQQTFMLLKHLAQEGDFFLPFPYSRSYKVLWRVFDKLFTDFRDCFSGADYHEALAGAKSRFQPVPSSWIGH